MANRVPLDVEQSGQVISSGLSSIDNLLLGNGYPDRSTILVVGGSDVEKDLILYSFILEGTRRGDFCLYATRHSVADVLSDAKVSGFDLTGKDIFWIAADQGQLKYSADDFTRLSFDIKQTLGKNRGRRIRLVTDILSSLLLLNVPETIYRFLSQLFNELRQYSGVQVATIDEGMHDSRAIAAMEELFDGILHLSRDEHGSLKVKLQKMKSIPFKARQGESIVVESIKPQSREMEKSRLDRRIAVLPFTNISPDPNDEYFADGLTEELIDRLCQVEELEVIARTSVMAFKKSGKKAAEIAKELRVGSLVEGSVRKAANRLRVTAQLVNASTEGHIWSSRYDEGIEDIFAVQSDIALKIVDALKINLLSETRMKIGKEETRFPEAYIAYLKGIFLGYKYGEGSLRKAVEYFERAIELDGNYCEAIAGLANCYIHLGYLGLEPLDKAYSKAKELAKRAITLGPTVAEAHRAMSRILYFYEWDWAGFGNELRRSLEFKPGFVDAMCGYSWYLLQFDRNNEAAVAEVMKAVDLDPLSVYVHQIAANILALAGREDEAIQEFKKALELDPDSPGVHGDYGEICLDIGRIDVGIKELEKAVELSGGSLFYRATLGNAKAIVGERDEVHKIIAELEENRSKGFSSASYNIASLYSDLGEISKALDYLERAYDERAIVFTPIICINPRFARLRPEPRYKAIMKKLNLPEIS